MKRDTLTHHQKELLDLDGLIDGVTEDVLLTPVRCVDCDQWVPIGWVEFPASAPHCPVNASRAHSHGHRALTTTLVQIKDSAVNAALRTRRTVDPIQPPAIATLNGDKA